MVFPVPARVERIWVLPLFCRVSLLPLVVPRVKAPVEAMAVSKLMPVMIWSAVALVTEVIPVRLNKAVSAFAGLADVDQLAPVSQSSPDAPFHVMVAARAGMAPKAKEKAARAVAVRTSGLERDFMGFVSVLK